MYLVDQKILVIRRKKGFAMSDVSVSTICEPPAFGVMSCAQESLKTPDKKQCDNEDPENNFHPRRIGHPRARRRDENPRS